VKKGIALGILVFAISSFLSFWYIYAFIGIFVRFDMLSNMIQLQLSTVLGIVFAIIVLVYLIYCIKSTKITKWRNWLSQNYPKLLLLYMVSVIAYGSISPEKIMEYSDLKDLISVCWTISGISIAMFLVWIALIIKELKNKQPQEPSQMSKLDRVKYIESKANFYPFVITCFNSIAVLCISLILVIMATAAIYVITIENHIVTQNIVVVSFYFCTNSFIMIFVDILRPIYADRKEILRQSKVTDEDIELQNEVNKYISNIITVYKELSELDCVSSTERLEIITEMLENLTVPRKKSQNDDSSEGGNP